MRVSQGFLSVRSPQQAFAELRPHLSPIEETELLPSSSALGRVTGSDVHSPEDLPAFPRSAMDGYSVCARDTFGASEVLPALLEVVGDIPAGRAPELALRLGQAAVAYTGGALAGGADAVVMTERTQPADESSIEVLRPVAPGENVVQVGEDVRPGDLLLRRRHLVRPQDIGGLLALGITDVRVVRRPRVGIVSTGDELVPPEVRPDSGQIRDINSHTVSARVLQCGGEPVLLGLEPDDYEAQLSAARVGIESVDVLVFSAGSSLSTRDMTAHIFGELGEPGVLVHGISIKPGKPTIVGAAQGKPLFGLPGNPVSAMVVFDLLVAPTIRVLAGMRPEPARKTVRAALAEDVPSESGREDYVPVRLSCGECGTLATPVFGKSGLITTLINSDGIVQVPLNSGGLYKGETVDIHLFES